LHRLVRLTGPEQLAGAHNFRMSRRGLAETESWNKSGNQAAHGNGLSREYSFEYRKRDPGQAVKSGERIGMFLTGHPAGTENPDFIVFRRPIGLSRGSELLCCAPEIQGSSTGREI